MTPFEAGLQSVAVGALLFVVGFFITGMFAERLGLNAVVRLALAVPALLAFVCVVAVAHIATGGEVLARPAVVRTATAVVLVGGALLMFRRRTEGRALWRDGDVRVALGFVVVAVAIWCLPIFTNLPVSFHGDVKRHMAWAAQLSAGYTTPTGVITGEIPNYYPWLFHAFASFTAAFAPGGRVLHALGPLQVLAVTGSVLAFFAVGRELFGSRAAASASALFGALSGGFGFLLTWSPTLVLDPRVPADVARFKGDFMFLRSYNLAFHNLAPPFPRDFGYLLVVAVVLLLAMGLKRGRVAFFAGAGCALGLTGLMTGESLIVGALFSLVFIAVGPGIGRVRAAVAVAAPALTLYALWLVPVAINYTRLGGFAKTSGAPVTLPPLTILFSWGIAVPFALIGVCAWHWWRSPEARVVLSFVTASGIAVAAARLVPRLDEGFTTLGRLHRYWPLVYVGVALVGSLGAGAAWRRLVAIRRLLGWVVALLVAGAALASPLLASVALSRQPIENPDLATALRGDGANVLNQLGDTHGQRCVVVAPEELSRSAPAYTGARLVYFPSENQAGIRWPTLPDAVPDDERLADHRALISGTPDEEGWRAIVARYGIDLVVVPGTSAPPSAAAYPQIAAEGAQGPYVVIHTGTCS